MSAPTEGRRTAELLEKLIETTQNLFIFVGNEHHG
jgi:hypothetical protein